jgi:hypothetical protein
LTPFGPENEKLSAKALLATGQRIPGWATALQDFCITPNPNAAHH